MLDIRDLVHVYPDGTRALDGVTLSAPAGVLGLLGPNGAGKSSLMRCLCTLQRPTAGSIGFDGIDVLAEPQRLRQALGYLPQDFGVYPRVTARQMLEHLAVLKGLADRHARREAVDAMLARVGLWEARDRTLEGLSGGMRRRFGVAQALIGAPRLVVVDEPTAGLDPEERNRLLDLLASVGEQVVVILSTHIVEDVADLCPRVAVLAAGRIRLQGAPADLVAAMRDRVWRTTVPHDAVDALRMRLPMLSTRLSAGRTMVRVQADVSPGPGFEAAAPTLEDVYFSTLAASRPAR